MSKIDYDNRKFRVVQNSNNGEVCGETIFHYRQTGQVVIAEYSGGEIIAGNLLAICDAEGRLDMRYHHINTSCELMTGVCHSHREFLTDGRIRLHETWQWESGDRSSGYSLVEEFFDE